MRIERRDEVEVQLIISEQCQCASEVMQFWYLSLSSAGNSTLEFENDNRPTECSFICGFTRIFKFSCDPRRVGELKQTYNNNGIKNIVSK